MDDIGRWIIGGALLIVAVALRIWADSFSAQTQRWKTFKKWLYRKGKM